MQMLVLTALFNVDIPENAYMVMEMILKMCSLDFLQTDYIFEYLFDFQETEAFNKVANEEGEMTSKYPEAGYESSNFFLLLGPLFFIIILFIVLIVFKKIAKVTVRKCCPAANNRLTRYLYKRTELFVIVTRFMLEGCIEIGLSAMICVLMMSSDNFKNSWEVVSNIFACLSLLALLLAPFFFHRVTK